MLSFSMPATPGQYDFRLFENDTYVKLGTSQTVTVASTTISLNPVPGGVLTVGGTAALTGSGFTAGTRIKLFVNTGSGSLDACPSGCAPSSVTGTSLTWDVPATIPLAAGFGSIYVVNTDQCSPAPVTCPTSATRYALLYGDPADNLPTITSIGGVGLSPADPGVPVAHVDTVIQPGSTVTIAGAGFNNPGVNLFGAPISGPDPSPTANQCGGVNYGPFFPEGSSTSFQIDMPSIPAGPANFVAVNDPYAGNVQSNSVFSVAGARPSISSVSVSGDEVTVLGTGFSCLSVINLFNLQGSTVVNLGGLTGDSQRVIPLRFVSASELRFLRPAGAQAGPAFVEVLNPPYIPFSSSTDDPQGSFTFP
jgi:hypothetical protein